MLQGPLGRDTMVGGVAGLIGGLVFWAILQGQGMTTFAPGLLGIQLHGIGILFHMLMAVALGAGFGAISRYQRGAYAAIITTGLLYGMLWWIIGPITIGVWIEGQAPTWSLGQAAASFTTLVGHLFYGGITGAGFFILVDIYLRFFPESEAEMETSWEPDKRIVVLGGGFGGVSTAQRLEKLFSRDPSVEIALVSQSNFLLFTPMLAGVATSALEAQHISAPIRAALTNARFLHAEVERIDSDTQTVRMRSGSSNPAEALHYDHLVLALGSIPNFYGMPGMEEHAFTLKSLDDASLLRNQIIWMLERADVELNVEERRRQLTFTVVGGGFAGVETIAELFDMVHSVLHYYPNIRFGDLRFVLIHSRDGILPELKKELGEYALRRLRARGIEFILGARVSGCTPDSVLMNNDTDQLETRTIVWTAGNQPNPILRTLNRELSRSGAIVVDSHLQAADSPNIWAIGDCAQIPDPEHEGQFYPPTAQHASREGKAVADNVAASIRGKPLKPFRFQAIGILVNLGRLTGAAEIMGIRFSGLLAWIMWRTTYLSKLPSMEKRIRVAIDWALDLLFPRDIVLTSSSDITSRTHGDASRSQDTGSSDEAEVDDPSEPEASSTEEGIE